MKGDISADPTGLIFESFRIEGVSERDCRTIFFDWALGVPAGADIAALVRELHAHYANRYPNHPMVAVLAEGISAPVKPAKRRGRREIRRKQRLDCETQRSETGR